MEHRPVQRQWRGRVRYGPPDPSGPDDLRRSHGGRPPLPVDVGVSENGTGSASPVTSIFRNPNGVWGGPATNTFGACNDGTTNDPPAGVVTTVLVLPPPPVTVVVGGTQQLTAVAFDAVNQPMAGVTFTWSTSAGAVATVDAAGLVAGVTVGSATITATAPNGVSGNVSVTVNAAAPMRDVITRVLRNLGA